MKADYLLELKHVNSGFSAESEDVKLKLVIVDDETIAVEVLAGKARYFALPLIKLAGSQKIGDEQWERIQYPIAHRILEKCDAVLRIKGESKGADQDVKIAKERGLIIYYHIDEIPAAEKSLTIK